LRAFPYGPGAARERLKRARYRGEAIYFETTAGMIANDRAMAEAIAEMWEDIGVRVVLDVIDTEAQPVGAPQPRAAVRSFTLCLLRIGVLHLVKQRRLTTTSG